MKCVEVFIMEKIGNVELDYTFYKGSDEYCDGDIEKEILEYVQNYDDEMEILKKDNRWPVLYHISPVRKNILEWYDFEENAEVLEVGAGCGAVTGAICEKTASVTSVDLSKQRSLINAYRNKKYDNLKIIVANFNDIVFEKKYDYITLIGVLEYAEYYTATNNSFVDFLRKLKGTLKENGKILIAIENKYGMKYWSGCVEDHTGRFYDGIMGYADSKSKVKTFSKDELINIFKAAGFENYNFYYPFPDYKFAQQIFSDDYLPKKNEIVCKLETYDNDRIIMFNETLAFNNIIDSGKFDFFSNSFFVEVSI